MKAEIRYLYNSGFAVKTSKHLFIFDYYLDKPKGCGLNKGVINPKEIADLNTVVFVSHKHPDHYNPKIFSWHKSVPHIRYILSNDIKTTQNNLSIMKVKPGGVYDLNDIKIKVLKSTDIGSAFLIYADRLCIFHAGDLNDWYWKEENQCYNLAMTDRYRKEIDKLKNTDIDIAFIPVDPRLEGNCLRGIDYFMEMVSAKLVIPMHFGKNASIFEELRTSPITDNYRDKIAFFSKRGDKIVFPKK